MLGLLSSIFYLGACAVSEARYANTKYQIEKNSVKYVKPWVPLLREAQAISEKDGQLFIHLKDTVEYDWNGLYHIGKAKYAVRNCSEAGRDVCMKYLKLKGIVLEFTDEEISVYKLERLFQKDVDSTLDNKTSVDIILDELYMK